MRSSASILALSPILALLGLSAPGCTEQNMSFDVRVEACIVSTACGVKAYPRVSDCLDAYFNLHRRFGLGPVYDAIYRCANAANGNCEAVRACFGSLAEESPCDTSFTARCDGNRAVFCDTIDRRVYSHDCAWAGLVCKVPSEPAFDAHCTTDTCTPGSPPTCDASRQLTCHSNGIIEVVDCGSQGLSCGISNITGLAECVGESKDACKLETYAPSCDANRAVTCVHGWLHYQDCSQFKHRSACIDGACTIAYSLCKDELDRCEEDKLQICFDGRWVTYDCAELGLGPCREADNGAACRPLSEGPGEGPPRR
jgi:hypothetical protein